MHSNSKICIRTNMHSNSKQICIRIQTCPQMNLGDVVAEQPDHEGRHLLVAV